MNNGIFAKYTGIPIIVVPDSKKQNRTHRKNRINKRKTVEFYEEMANKYSDNPRLAELVTELKGLGA